MDYPHPYLDLYNASAIAIKDVHPSLQVGGPATAGMSTHATRHALCWLEC
jgi:hypothetical protein